MMILCLFILVRHDICLPWLQFPRTRTWHGRKRGPVIHLQKQAIRWMGELRISLPAETILPTFDFPQNYWPLISCSWSTNASKHLTLNCQDPAKFPQINSHSTSSIFAVLSSQTKILTIAHFTRQQICGLNCSCPPTSWLKLILKT